LPPRLQNNRGQLPDERLPSLETPSKGAHAKLGFVRFIHAVFSVHYSAPYE